MRLWKKCLTGQWLRTAALTSVFLTSFCWADANEQTAPVEIDIHALGFVELVAVRDQNSYASLRTPLVFTDDTTLGVSFPAPNPKPGLSERATPLGGGFLFHTTFVDAQTGRTKNGRDWGNASPYNALVPFNDGRFLVQLGGLLQLYDDLGQQEAFGFQEPSGDIYGRPVTSPDRSRLFFFTPKKQGIELTAVDPHNFKRLGTVQLDNAIDFSVSPNFLVYVTSLEGKPNIAVRSLTGKKFSVPQQKNDGCYGVVPTFVSDRYLLLTGGCENLTFLPIDGKEAEQIRLPQKSGGLVQVSADGTTVAFLMYKSRSLDVLGEVSYRGLQVGVADVASGKMIFNVAVGDVGGKFGFALSPNGSHLAVLTSPKVRIWKMNRGPASAGISTAN